MPDAPDLLIAGLRFRLASVDEASRAEIDERLPEFHAPRDGGAAPDVTIAIAFSGEDPPNPTLHGSDAVIERLAPGRIAARRFDFEGTWDRATGEARVVAMGLGSLYSFLRIVSSFAIVDRGGVLLHASSVVSNGRTFVFAGPSGAGKTTLAGLGAPRPVLTDEVTAIRPDPADPERYVCHPTPFWGDMVRVRAGSAAPLAAIGFPHHAARAALRPASRADSYARLLECCIVFDLARPEKDALLGTVGRIVSRTVCLHVEYALDQSPWELLDALPSA